MNDHFEIAAWYGFAIARGHTFIDGNKRTALITMISYLNSCGIEMHFTDTDEKIAGYMELLADGKIEVSQLTDWLKNSSIL